MFSEYTDILDRLEVDWQGILKYWSLKITEKLPGGVTCLVLFYSRTEVTILCNHVVLKSSLRRSWV